MNHLLNYQGLLNIAMKEEDLPPIDPIALFYGEPGVGKSSLGITCGKKSFLWNFNEGAHRAIVRAEGTAELVPWANMQQLESNGFFEALRKQGIDCLVYDTIEDVIWKSIVPWLFTINPNFSTPRGQLQMYGALKKEFQRHFYFLRSLGFTIVFIAHQKVEGNRTQTDNLRVKPLITGGSYDIVMSAADVVGFIYADAQKNRVVSFNPTPDYYAKNPLQLNDMVITHIDQSQPVPVEFETFGLERIISPVREITRKMGAQLSEARGSAPAPAPAPTAPTAPAPLPPISPEWQSYLLSLTPESLPQAEAHIAGMPDSPEKAVLISALADLRARFYPVAPPVVPPAPVAPPAPPVATAPPVGAPATTPPVGAPVAAPQNFDQLGYQICEVFRTLGIPKEAITFEKLREIALIPAVQSTGLSPQSVDAYSPEVWTTQILPVAKRFYV